MVAERGNFDSIRTSVRAHAPCPFSHEFNAANDLTRGRRCVGASHSKAWGTRAYMKCRYRRATEQYVRCPFLWPNVLGFVCFDGRVVCTSAKNSECDKIGVWFVWWACTASAIKIWYYSMFLLSPMLEFLN